MSRQAQDTNGHIAPLTFVPGTNQNITVAGTTARVATALTGRILRLASTTDAYVELGASSVEADNTAMVVPAGTVTFVARGSHTHVAALQVTTGGTLSVTEMN